jgi:type IV secretory pathway TrbD component
LLKNYRGKIARDNRVATYVLAGAGLFVFLIAVMVGFFIESWFWCMFLVILYILGYFLATYAVKRRQSKLLR